MRASLVSHDTEYLAFGWWLLALAFAPIMREFSRFVPRIELSVAIA